MRTYTYVNVYVRASTACDNAQLETLRAPHAGALQAVEWQYETRGTWSSMECAANDQLLKEYIACTSGAVGPIVSVRSGDRQYKNDFETWTQENPDTGMSRQITVNCKNPVSWTTPAHILLQQSRVSQYYVQKTEPRVCLAIKNLVQCSGGPLPLPYSGRIRAGGSSSPKFS